MSGLAGAVLALAVLLAAVVTELSTGWFSATVGVSFGPWQLTTVAWVALMGLLLGWLVVHWLVRALLGVAHVPRQVAGWRTARRDRGAADALRSIVDGLRRGTYRRAESASRRLARVPGLGVELRALSGLLGSFAAYRAGDCQALRAHLERSALALAGPDHELEELVAFVAAGANERAATVQALDAFARSHPENVEAAWQLATYWARLERWDALEAPLSVVRASEMSTELVTPLVQAHLTARLRRCSGAAARAAAWRSLGPAERTVPVVLAYASAMVDEALDDDTRADLEREVRKTLDRGWSDALGEVYAAIPLTSTHESLARVARLERWQARWPDAPGLALVAGHAAAQQRLWGKARVLLRSSHAARPSVRACLELAELERTVGEHLAAQTWTARGLALMRRCASSGAAAQLAPPSSPL